MNPSQQGPPIFEAPGKEPRHLGAGPSDSKVDPSGFCCELADP